MVLQCLGTARYTGCRCNIKWDLVGGYCEYHQGQNFAIPKCQGFYFGTSTPCVNPVKLGYNYCCVAHNPSEEHFSPRMFDSDVYSRSNLQDQVVARYNGRDLYHADALDMTTPGWVELDHILEKQCFAYAFHYLNFNDVEDRQFVADIVRDDVANRVTNLCFTRATTNRIKGKSTFKFLDDCITGHVGRCGNGSTFTDYLVAEYRDGTRLKRTTTRTIAREMGIALKESQRRLADQGETPILDELSYQLQRLYVTMQLRSDEERSMNNETSNQFVAIKSAVVKSSTKSDAMTSTKSSTKTDAKTSTKSSTKHDAKKNGKSSTTPSSKSSVKSSTKSSTKHDAKSSSKTDAKTSSKSSTKHDAKTSTKSSSKTDAKTDAKTSTKTSTKSSTKSDTKSSVKSDTKSSAKTDKSTNNNVQKSHAGKPLAGE